jgi:Ca2+-dependent lipid-binding protein
MMTGHGGKPLHESKPVSKSSKSPLEDFEGELAVALIRARNLIKTDLVGKSDPYAVLKFGKQKDKTNVIKNTLDPQWDFHTNFKLPEGDTDSILIEVFDSDKLGKDKSLGKAEVNVIELDAGDSQWIPLQGVKSGEILVNADLVPRGQESSIPVLQGPPIKGAVLIVIYYHDWITIPGLKQSS